MRTVAVPLVRFSGNRDYYKSLFAAQRLPGVVFLQLAAQNQPTFLVLSS